MDNFEESINSLDAGFAFLDASFDEDTESATVGVEVSPPPLATVGADLDELLQFISDVGDQDPTKCQTRRPKNTEPVNSESAGPVAPTTTAIVVKQPEKKKKKLNYDPNKARNQRRFEVAFLRKEVEDLEMTLRQLQKTKEGSAAQQKNQLTMSVSRSKRPAIWEGICARQYERRLRVERENIHLKMMYSKQLQIAKSLERLMHKRMTMKDMKYADCGYSQRTEIPSRYMTNAAAQNLNELLASLDGLYHEVDAVFEAVGSLPDNVGTREPMQPAEGVEVKFFDDKVMPFDMKATGDAWWHQWHDFKGQQVNVGAGNTITETFGLVMNDEKTNTYATFCMQQALRRYVESDRIVVIWSGYIWPIEFGKKRVAGVRFLERSYVLIQPHHIEAAAASDACITDSTRVLTCYRMSPQMLSNTKKKDANISALIEFVMNASAADIRARSVLLENWLLDHAVQE